MTEVTNQSDKGAVWACSIQPTGRCGIANVGEYQTLINGGGTAVNVTVQTTNYDAFGTARGSYTQTYTLQPGGRESLGCTHGSGTDGKFVTRVIVGETQIR